MVQTFKIILRIVMHFEVRKRVQRNLTIFNQYNLKLLYIVMYQQEENLVQS